MKLSENFTLEEMIFSPTAIRLGIDNTPSQEVIDNLKLLCEHVLEPLRTLLGKPIHITSGYRCPVLNKAIGGAETSQHQFGKAADIHVDGMSTEDLFVFARESGIVVDQGIQEFASQGGWVHLSWQQNARKMYLIAEKINGKTTYSVYEG